MFLQVCLDVLGSISNPGKQTVLNCKVDYLYPTKVRTALKKRMVSQNFPDQVNPLHQSDWR